MNNDSYETFFLWITILMIFLKMNNDPYEEKNYE